MSTPRSALIWLIVSQAISALSLVPWVFVAGMAVMAFDAPGSTDLWGPWLFAGTIWSYPLWVLASAILAWVLYAQKRLRGATVATSVPIAIIAAAALFVIFIAG
jgi:hypothetical protein